FVVSPFEPGPERGVGLAAGQARLRATAPDITWCVEGETQRTVGAPGDHQRQRDPELFGGGSHEFVGLPLGGDVENCVVPCPLGPGAIIGTQRFQPATAQVGIDRKSTRLNSSHVSSSYAVFCLKKKKCSIACLRCE